MKDFFASWIITFSFFTVLPLPVLEWTERRLKHIPLLMPIAGLFIGGCGYLLYLFLLGSALSILSKGVIMTLTYLILTGGLHMDGLMDMSDAFFSRTSIERKLEIMKDSHIGAFGVMVFGSVILLKIVFFTELFAAGSTLFSILLLIPVLSRIFQALVLCTFPCAKAEGLAAAFQAGTGKKTLLILGLYFLLTTGAAFCLTGDWKSLVLPGVMVLFFACYFFFVKRSFGGITGDVVGGFVELAELLMLGILVFI